MTLLLVKVIKLSCELILIILEFVYMRIMSNYVDIILSIRIRNEINTTYK